MRFKVTLKSLVGWGMVSLLSFASLAAASGDLRLVEAVKKDDKEAVRSLLEQQVDVNTPQADGATALAWAAYRDDLETADLLIRAGADVSAANDYGVTPLSLACANRNAAMVEKLLEAGADPNAAQWTGETALMTAARTGDVDVVKSLLAHGADVNANETRRGHTALMWAVAERYQEVVRTLIEHGADVHARSQRLRGDFSPMLLATYQADVQAGSPGGYTALLFAAQQGDLDSARMLLEAGADVNEATPEGGSALVVAANGGYEELALFLLEKGADSNAVDDGGLTALHYSLREGLKTLHGINERYNSPRGTDKKKNTADFSKKYLVSSTPQAGSSVLPGRNMPELMKVLLAHGADPNARIVQAPAQLRVRKKPPISVPGATPFLLAAAVGDVNAMRFLVEGGAKPLPGTEVIESEMTFEGYQYSDTAQIQANVTPLLVAAGMGRSKKRTENEERETLEAVKLALALGADVNSATATGWTALHAAAFTGADTIVQFLVDTGAKMDVQNGCGQTPLSLADGSDPRGLLERPEARESTTELLRSLGAGATPLSGPVGRCVEGRYFVEYQEAGK